jgi:hypothetical protein
LPEIRLRGDDHRDPTHRRQSAGGRRADIDAYADKVAHIADAGRFGLE